MADVPVGAPPDEDGGVLNALPGLAGDFEQVEAMRRHRKRAGKQ